jgi:hypothetical protein
MLESNNAFSLDYYSSIIKKALSNGYKFCTVTEYFRSGCPKEKHFILRHDIDVRPRTVQQMIDIENQEGVKATYYVRLCGSPYNPFDYEIFSNLKSAEKLGHEIGLHTNPLEFARILNLDPIKVIKSELEMLNQHFNITSMSTHRDMDYAYNSLPWLIESWNRVKEGTNLEVHAYDEDIFKNSTYVNEGTNPHITWRNLKPEDVIDSGATVYMLTHNHWWHKNHPFEAR